MKGRSICLTGMATPSLKYVFDLPSGTEVWTLNETVEQLERLGDVLLKPTPVLSRTFQIHVRNWREPERELCNGALPEGRDHDSFGRGQRHVDWLRNCGIPVYCRVKWQDIPTCVVYPFERVRQAVGPWNRAEPSRRDLYLTNTACYMVALALTEHLEGQTVKKLHLAGVELNGFRERYAERMCLEYYLGMAEGMGIKVLRSPYGVGILEGPLYGKTAWPETIPGALDDLDRMEDDRAAVAN